MLLATAPVLAAASWQAMAATGPGEAMASAIAKAEASDPSGQPAETEAAWRKVLALEESAATPEALLRARAYNRIADTFYYRGRPDLGQAEMEHAVAVLEEAGLGATDMMSETLTNLGVMLSAQGHAERDVAMQRRSLAIRKKLYIIVLWTPLFLRSISNTSACSKCLWCWMHQQLWVWMMEQSWGYFGGSISDQPTPKARMS